VTRVIAIEPLGVGFIALLPDSLRLRARTVVGEGTTGTWRTLFPLGGAGGQEVNAAAFGGG
jgi:hypothetical protein